MRWTIRADVPVVGAMRQAFPVVQTDDSPHRIEWAPAAGEKKNLLRYAARFDERGDGNLLVRIEQRVELRRQSARELHLLAGLVGEGRLSAEMQKAVAAMMQSFLHSVQAGWKGMQCGATRKNLRAASDDHADLMWTS